MKKKLPSVFGIIPVFWYLFFLGIPLLLVLLTSFFTRGHYGNLIYSFSIDAYARLFQWQYIVIFWQSLKLATLTSVLCLIFGYPLAWAIVTCNERWKNCFLILIALPFFLNLVIRIFSLRILFSYDGLVAQILQNLAIPYDPYALSQNWGLVLYGMVTTYLPFMIFPLYVALEKFDYAQVEACVDLGGNAWNAFYQVLWPNTKSAVASGLLMVFVPSFGEYVIPDLLGGAKSMLIGNLVTEQFLKARNWPFGAALAVLLMLILSTAAYVIYVWGNKRAWPK